MRMVRTRTQIQWLILRTIPSTTRPSSKTKKMAASSSAWSPQGITKNSFKGITVRPQSPRTKNWLVGDKLDKDGIQAAFDGPQWMFHFNADFKPWWYCFTHSASPFLYPCSFFYARYPFSGQYWSHIWSTSSHPRLQYPGLWAIVQTSSGRYLCGHCLHLIFQPGYTELKSYRRRGNTYSDIIPMV